MMSDDDRDMDMYSDDDDGDLGDDDSYDKNNIVSSSSGSSKPMTQAEKRAHHNALERKRRDHIKDSFTNLRDSVPALHGEKVSKRVSSRAQILKKAAEYIQFMRRKNSAHQHDIEDLKRQNHILENQIRSLETAKMSGNVRTTNGNGTGLDLKLKNHSDSDGSDGEMHSASSTTPKKMIKTMKVGGSSIGKNN